MRQTDRVLQLLPRLTDRDRQLLDWLADHQVLTTPQIDQALFGSLRFTQRRLHTLHRLGVLDRFRPLRPGGGSYSWHHVLGPVGADLVAATRDQPPPRPGETARRARRIATGRLLAHRLGVNQFFTDLAGHARTHCGSSLDRWWSEARCAAPGAFAPGLLTPVRPDGHGIWTENDRQVAFYLEYDTGSEDVGTLVAKLAAYDTHIARGGPPWPVLFWLPSPAREQHLRERMARGGAHPYPIATAAPSPPEVSASPASAGWATGHAPATRCRLSEIR